MCEHNFFTLVYNLIHDFIDGTLNELKMHYLHNNYCLTIIKCCVRRQVFCDMICNKPLPASGDVTDMNAVGSCNRAQGNYDEAISWHKKARQLHLRQDHSPDRDENVAIS